jgi:hypothetical protein
MADEFEPEFGALDKDVQTEILALSLVLGEFGPQLGRPHVDTLNGDWPSPLIPNAGRFCWWRETNREGAKKYAQACLRRAAKKRQQGCRTPKDRKT